MSGIRPWAADDTWSTTMPQLSRFIAEHSEKILDAWEAFAKKLPTTQRVDVGALRDHAQGILNVIVADLDTPQTEEHRDRKSRGLEDTDGQTQTAASEHGRGRAEHGFSSESTVAEFRALRASVISLWMKQQPVIARAELEEMRRFNEAIDQAIAESLAQYSHDVNAARDRFLAVLAHDLRTPVSAILLSSRVLLEEGGLTHEQDEMLSVMERSAQRMTHLIDDLLDLAFAGFGEAFPLHRARTDLGALVREVGDEVKTTARGARIDVETSGPLVGHWDQRRLAEALTNLLSNAVAHGAPGKPIMVNACGDGDVRVTIDVTNEGRPIPGEQMSSLFNPMKRATGGGTDRRHLGLGLYIVNRIVEAHGGSIDVRSSNEHGTTFRITIPRDGAPKPG
jgi:signal transduction histidine kinase